MPLASAVPTLQKDIQAALEAAFAREFASETGSNDAASDSHKRMAKAISDIAIPIIATITSQALVIVSTPTGPGSGQVT